MDEIITLINFQHNWYTTMSDGHLLENEFHTWRGKGLSSVQYISGENVPMLHYLHLYDSRPAYPFLDSTEYNHLPLVLKKPFLWP